MADVYEATENAPRRGSIGNAGGRPILPVLVGLALVAVIFYFAFVRGRAPGQVNKSTSESKSIPTAQYPPANTAETAVGRMSGRSDTNAFPAAAARSGTSVSGASALPAERDRIAPPGPAHRASNTAPEANP